MGQSERSELVTNRLRDNDGLKREDLNSGGESSTTKKPRNKPLANYLEVIADESEDNAQHVVQMLQERSNSFFIDGSVAQTERQPESDGLPLQQ